jgi:conjugal transfer pilus assembly protein TraV
MASYVPLVPLAALALVSSGCVGLGTNIEGDFTCRAPKGDCAPSHVIDQRATAELGHLPSAGLQTARVRAGIASGDLARTSERTIRIVFPAHVDEAGTLHDEAVAWAVVENPQWAGALRRKESADAPALMRQLRKQLKAAQNADADAPSEGPFTPDSSAETNAPLISGDTSPFPLASPLALPSTAAEAIAGAQAPAVEGFDMSSPPHDRTPRPHSSLPGLQFPSLDALAAAKTKKAKAHESVPDHTATDPASKAAGASPEEKK